MTLFQGELFDTSNIVVCQYDRISKARNKWKFNLKNGVSLEPSSTYHYSTNQSKLSEQHILIGDEPGREGLHLLACYRGDCLVIAFSRGAVHEALWNVISWNMIRNTFMIVKVPISVAKTQVITALL